MDMNEPLLHIQPPAWRGEDDDVRTLFLRNFVAHADIGVYDSERTRRQPLRIHLVVYLTPPFDWHDRLEDVLDYDKLRQGILDILGAGHINLLETLGQRVLAMCFAYAQVCAVHLQIAKIEAHEDCEVGYEVRRRR